jgi:hypothetical protein
MPEGWSDSGQPVLHRLALAGGPFGRQPAHGQFRVVDVLADLASGGPDAQGHETGGTPEILVWLRTLTTS